MKLTGRDGVLRILDATRQIADAAQGNMQVRLYDATGPTWSTRTAAAYADDTSYTGAFLADTGDKVYVGFTRRFAMIRFLANVLAVGAGALTAKYYNGSAWVAAVGVNDGLAVGGNTFAQNGFISHKIQPDWAKRGYTELDADKYFIELSCASVPGTPPDADILAPVDGQYFEVAFAGMDFQGPLGRPRTEEMLVLDRQRMNEKAHYIEGADGPIFEPVEISFSCLIDDVYNKDDILEALACGNPGTTLWGAAGTTAKGTTKNDGVNSNPAFADANKKCVNVQILWDSGQSGAVAQGMAFYEVYFPEDEQSVTEGEDGVTLSCRGAVYGVIERIHAIANRY